MAFELVFTPELGINQYDRRPIYLSYLSRHTDVNVMTTEMNDQ